MCHIVNNYANSYAKSTNKNQLVEPYFERLGQQKKIQITNSNTLASKLQILYSHQIACFIFFQ
jgi:hypothetical protein